MTDGAAARTCRRLHAKQSTAVECRCLGTGMGVSSVGGDDGGPLAY